LPAIQIVYGVDDERDEMRFKGLDLNLLVALDTMLELRNVTRAAERMNLSQPAASAALARLREYFRDELLVVHGRRMYPTAFAERIHGDLRACLAAANAVVTTSSPFDPLTAERTFRIIGSDYVVASVLVKLARNLATTAPNVALEFILPDENSSAMLARGELDLMISPADYILPQLPRELLYEEDHVVAGWAQNPLLAHPMSEDAFLEARHVTVTIGAQQTKVFADRQLDSMGRRRRLDVVASSFTVLPWLLIGTDRIAVMHQRLAAVLSEQFPLAFQPLPFPFPTMSEMVQYHPTRSADEGLRWLISQIQRAAGETAQPPTIQNPDG
jgi:LysR family nod box-dependent transcriptional activator